MFVRNKRMRIILSKFSFVNLICTIGCLAQFYEITRRFLQFKVRSDVSYKYTDIIVLPDIDIVIPLATAINLTQVYKRYPKKVTQLCEELTSNRSENFTLEQFIEVCDSDFKSSAIISSFALASFVTVEDIEKLTDDPRDNIISMVWSKANKDILKEKCHLSRYFSGYAIYLRIACLNNSNPFTMNMNTATMNMNIFGALYNRFRPYYGLRFTDPKGLPEPEFTSYFIIDYKPGEFPLSAVSYTKTISKSLMKPYETKCQYYNKIKSIFTCVMNSSLSQKDPFLFPTMVYEWGKYPSNLRFSPSAEIDGNYNNDQIIKNCSQKLYANECEKVTYRMEGKIYRGSVKINYGTVLLEPPRAAIIYMKAYPKLPLSEYLIFVGSILGIWFGFSASEQLTKIIQYIKKRSPMIKQKAKFENEIEPTILKNTIQYWKQQANQKGKLKNDKILWISAKYRRDNLRSRN